MKKRIAAIMLLMLMLLAGCGENTPAETPAPERSDTFAGRLLCGC